MRNKLFIFIFTASSFLISCKNTVPEYEKKVVFETETSIEQKVKQAAHVVPTPQQLNWQKLEMTAFIHFTVNTFTNMEWGHGDESPEIFNPTQLDARQWVRTLKDGGMKLVILTCKHHDGFCLWPTKTTKHSVASSPWKDGKGDVVRELLDACTEFGMKFGVYLSPWDRNAQCYGDSPKYNGFFTNQLTELLTWYGKVDEVWFDGANGEGPNGKKQEYDWNMYYDTIHKLQPDAVVAIVGEDVRWVGTESGYGRETEWSVTALAPGGRPENAAINTELGINAMTNDLGSREVIGKVSQLFWYPAEVDVSIRPGWFYHESEDNQVKSLAKMVDIYFSSVGRNAVLLLNVPPDTRGLIHENDVARLKEFRGYIDEMLDEDILLNAASSTKKAAKSVDGKPESYWEINELPAVAEFNLPEKKRFNVLSIQEFIEKGQRVEKFKVEAMVDGDWKEIANSTTIGYKKMLRFLAVETNQIRLTIEEARDGALISSFNLYEAPELLSDPVIQRDKNGMVSITAETPHPVITYTLDGSEPVKDSKRYTESFALPEGGEIKAKSFVNNFTDESAVVVESYDICPAKWKVIDADSSHPNNPAEMAIDGNSATMWHTPWGNDVAKQPHYISVDLGENLLLKGFTYTPRTDHNKSGTAYRYAFYVSGNGTSWKLVPTKEEFSNIKNNPVKQFVRFEKPQNARYFKFVSKEAINGEDWVSAGEIEILTK
jgi:alpha-L-fucosidase